MSRSMRVIAVAVVALAACTNGQVDPVKVGGLEEKANAAIQSADPLVNAACNVVTGLDAGFHAVAAAGKVDANGVGYEKSVMQVHDALCTGGAPSDVADTLARLWYAASAISGITPTKAALPTTSPAPSRAPPRT
jgi:hypothetical protein